MFRAFSQTPLPSYGWPACSLNLRRTRLLNGSHYVKRRFSWGILAPPAAFIGLGLALWAYKCLMMVAFQNRIIYMPSIPPYSRSERLEDYAQRCYPVKWEEERVTTSDKTRISIVSGHLEIGDQDRQSDVVEGRRLLVLYFQGNASSLPPRTPFLADTMKAVRRLTSTDDSLAKKPMRLDFAAVSYRGFWTSRGRPSQKGIELDAEAALDWAVKKYSSTPNLNVVLWGQSIGAGVATTAAAKYQDAQAVGSAPINKLPMIKGLILETPFTHLSDLLRDFYPQRWLPYKYLTPFLLSHWDSKVALQRISQARDDEKPRIFILQAGKDEVVPSKHGDELEEWCKRHNLNVERKNIHGALHTEIASKSAGREAIARYLLKFL